MKARGKDALTDVNRHGKMTSVMALDGVNSFWGLKDVSNTCKRMRNSPTVAGFLQCNGGKLEEAGEFKCFLFLFLYVRIEIDLL